MVESILTSVEFQMSLLLFVAFAGYILASRINQSIIICEIILGLIIGPSVLGLVSYTEFIKNIAQLGAIILLFVVGLEFKLKEIMKFKYGIIALIGVIVPWICGYYLTVAFGYSEASAIFIATSLTATSIAITANVLKEMGQLQSEAAKAIIGAAVIDDILSLLALSISNQVFFGEFSLSNTIFILLKAILFLAVLSYIGIKYLSKLLEKFDSSHMASKYPEFIFIFAMAIAFAYAMIAEYIGLSPIVGAFIAGLSLEGVIIKHGKSYKEGAEYLYIIFGSVFFVSLGVIVDMHVLTLHVVWFLLALSLVAILTKLIGCYIPSRLFGLSHKESSIVGWGMAPRGEVAMIVALIGLNQKVIGQELFISILIMSLITTIVTPIILKNFYYKNKN